MAAQKLITKPDEAYRKIRTRLVDDLGPVWNLINHNRYSPFWLLAREMFPIAESIGDLIYKHDDPSKNLADFIDKDLTKIRPEYRDKGKIIAQLYRHSLMHQDEPRSIYSGNVTIEWELAYIDGRKHLKTLSKDTRRHICRMSFDLRSFYEDIIELLGKYELNGPKRGIVKRYNSWTFKSYSDPEIKAMVKKF